MSRHFHYHKHLSDNNKNAKALWQGINEIIYTKKAGKTNNPSSLLIYRKSVTNQQEMAEHFNNFFTSTGNLKETIPSTRKDYTQYLKIPSKINFSIKAIKPKEICDTIETLKNSKSTGHNSIPTKIFKIIKKLISTALSTLINKSFANGTFSNVCKVAKVVPVFKSESRLLYNNYRPILLLSSIGKIIEKLMHQRSNQFLEDNECFYLHQFCFRLNISTNNALLSIIENIQSRLDNNEFAAGEFVDMKKAFDTVDHEIPIRKLKHYGVRDTARY